MRTGLILITCILLVGGAIAAEIQPPNLIVNGDFEEWEWAPLDADAPVLAEAKKRLKNKENLNLDYRGPLFRHLTGYAASLGRMVEGPEAYQGKSLYLTNDWKEGWLVVGLYGPYSGLLETGREYHWEIALKGQGAFGFRAWVGGIKAGQFKWLGFPDLIQVKVTDAWQLYQGKFTVPVLAEGETRQENKVSAAIVVGNGSTVYLDNFKVWPVLPPAAGTK